MKFATITAICIAASAMTVMAQNVPLPENNGGKVQVPVVPDVQIPAVPVEPMPDVQISEPPEPPEPPAPPTVDELKQIERSGAQMSPQDLRKLNKALEVKMRDLGRKLSMKMKELKSLQGVQIDTAGLANELKLARISLDSAKYSLRMLDSSVKFFDDGGMFGMTITDNSMPHGSRHNCSIVVRRDSTVDVNGMGTMRQKMVIIHSGDSAGGVMSQTTTTIFGGDGDDAQDLDDLAPEALSNEGNQRSMVIVNRDTTFINGDSHVNKIVKIMTDSSGGRTLILNGPANGNLESNQLYSRVMVLSGDAAKATLKGSDSMLTSGKTNVVIISSSKGRRARTTHEAAPAAEKRSVQQAAAVAGYALEKAAPNPAHDLTSIGYTIAKPGQTKLTLFDETGKVVKVVKDEMMSPGTYTERVDISGLPAGLYLYQLVSGDYTQSNTLTVMK